MISRALYASTLAGGSLFASTLSAATVALSLLAAGCDDKRPASAPGADRSEVVHASANATPAAAPTLAASHAPTATAGQAPRRLCAAEAAGAGRPLPPLKLDHLEASGVPALADRLAGNGRWLWVNLWAAWCAPCKEEIPRLRAWEAKLAAAGTPVTLAFVSLDDDERQARDFLDKQPPAGLRATWWLPDGKTRTGWLDALKMKDTPQLPMQLFFDPQGALRCVVNGAVDDSDFAQVQGVVAQH